MSDLPEADHLGETCPDCGAVHRTIESLPNSKLADSTRESLRNSNQIEFFCDLTTISGSSYDDDSERVVVEYLVLSTTESTKTWTRYEEVGWVVDHEYLHTETDDPKEVGERVFSEVQKDYHGFDPGAIM